MPSVQSDLFNYLKPAQQARLRPLLRVLKHPAQMELCHTLLDFLETGESTPPQNPCLMGLFFYLTKPTPDVIATHKPILTPLHITTHKSIPTPLHITTHKPIPTPLDITTKPTASLPKHQESTSYQESISD